MKSHVVPLDGSLALSVSISPCQFSCHLLQFFVLRVWRVRLSSVTDHESAVRDLSVRWHQHFKLSGFRTRVTLQQLPGGCERSIHWDLGGSAKSDNFYTINHFLTECKIYAPLHFQTLQAGDSFFFLLTIKIPAALGWFGRVHHIWIMMSNTPAYSGGSIKKQRWRELKMLPAAMSLVFQQRCFLLRINTGNPNHSKSNSL